MNTIGDAAEFLSGGTPRKSNEAFWNGDIPWFSASNMSGKFLTVSDLTITEQGLQAGSRMAPSGATLLLVRGSGLFNHIPICYADRDVAFNQDVKAIVAKDGVDPLYLHYTLEAHRRELADNLGVTGIGAGKFDTDLIKQLSFVHRAQEEQVEIGRLASAYDRKIELNRRMNATLEEMARVLFRDWFVDFGPTRRQMEGATDPTAIMGHAFPASEMPAEVATGSASGISTTKPLTAATLAPLFPEKLGDDGLPEGWEERPLDKIGQFLNGLALQKFPAQPGKPDLPVIKIAELRSGVSAKSNRASTAVPEKYVIGNGDFIFSWSGSLLAKFWTGGPGALNQHLFKVTSESHPMWFVSEWVHTHLEEFQRIAASKAVTMGHIKRSHLTEAKCVCPPNESLPIFGEVFDPLISKQIANDEENQTLAALRDLLLPKLMSGEIRLKDVEVDA